MNQIRFELIARDLVNYRKMFGMFSIQEAAAASGVSEMTVRNFENGKTFNMSVFEYYLEKVLYNFTKRTAECVGYYNEQVAKANEGEQKGIYYNIIGSDDIKHMFEKLINRLTMVEGVKDEYRKFT